MPPLPHGRHGVFRERRLLLRMLAATAWAGIGRRALADVPDSAEPDAPKPAAARLRELDPARLTSADVADVLAHHPAPRIVLLQGSVPIVTMAPFAAFLAGMGYPAARLADPRDGSVSESSYQDSAALAGTLAWHYEQEGVRPLLIGHSQGGMLVVRVLHELAGAFSSSLPVVDARSGQPEARTAIRDPLTGREQPVVGLMLPYAAALATGKLFRVLLGQWTMLSKLRRIPDSVEEFTGFALEGDVIGAGSDPYAATGRAEVRNILLPSRYSHIGLPLAEHLAADRRARAWIDAYVPGVTPLPADPPFDPDNLLHAADIWHSVKKHWCIEAQRLAAARARA